MLEQQTQGDVLVHVGGAARMIGVLVAQHPSRALNPSVFRAELKPNRHIIFMSLNRGFRGAAAVFAQA